MGEINSPAGLGAGRRIPPEVLVVGGQSQVGLRAEDAGRRGRKQLARNRLGLGNAVDGVGEGPIVRIAERQGAGADGA